MSLIAWYPFTKDFENKGLSNTISVTNGMLLANSIFSKDASFSGTSYIRMDYFPASEVFSQNSWSFSFWINFKNDGQRAIILGSYETLEDTYGGINIEINSGSYTSNCLRFWWYVGSNRKDIVTNVICDANTWVYITITYDGTSLKFYKNGSFVESYDYSLIFEDIESSWYLGRDRRSATSRTFMGNLHDFRIYNHCLSVKEIKELSKGLILHHALKGYGAGENILPLNSLYHSSIEYESDMGQTVYIRDLTTTTEQYLGWGRTPQVEQSTQYTFSCMLWLNDNVKSIDIFWLSDTEVDKKTGTGFVNITRIVNVSGLIINQWNYVTWTFTTPANDYTGYIRIDNNGSKTEGEHAIIKACCPKLEKGSKATPFLPYDLINTDIEEDLSGNGFNGTRQGVTFTPDSPRYYMSTEFDANKDLILDRIYHQGDEVSNLSVSIWANFTTSYTSGTNNCFWNLNENYFLRVERTGNNEIKVVAAIGDSGYQYFSILSRTITLNTWHHFVLTFDNGIIKFYMNGNLETTSDKTNVGTYLKCRTDTSRWSLGDYTQINNKFTGKLSDFRIYAKTLTADDIKELYQTSAVIDKSGKMFCGEFVEE